MNASLVNPLTTFSNEQIAANHVYNQTQTMTSSCYPIVSSVLEFLKFSDLKAFSICRSLDQVIMHQTGFHNHLLNKMLNTSSDQLEDIGKFIKRRGSVIKKIILNNIRPSLTDDQLQMIMENCPQLTSLKIKDQQNITDDGLKNFKLVNKLTNLKIIKCDRLTSQSVQYLRSSEKLKSLVLVLHPINDYELNRLTQSLNQLELFSLTECNEITSRGLSYLTAINLTSLNLIKITKIDNEGIKNIINLKNLESLSIVNCERINNEGLKQIVSLKKLAFLDLTASQITDQTVECLVELEDLQTLILKNCEGITEKALESIEKFKNLKTCRIGGTKIEKVPPNYQKSLESMINPRQENKN